MTPDNRPAAVLAPAAIICKPVAHRRVYVRDPRCLSLLRGAAVLTHEHARTGVTVGCEVAFAGGVTATVPPDWIADLPPELADNILAFRRAGARERAA